MKGERGFSVPGEEFEAVIGRLREGLSVLETIEAAGLLDALPALLDSRAGHQHAVSLLALLRRDLAALVLDMEASAAVAELLASVMTRARPTPKT